MRQRRLVIFFLLVLPVLGMGSFQASAGTPEPEAPVEYKVKAAFLLNFAKFITWPEKVSAEKDQPFTMCVLGEDPFGSSLAGIEARSVRGRKIKLRYIDSAEQATGCRLLFVSRSEKGRLGAVLAALQGKNVVTVSDIRGFADFGGSIEFVTRSNRLSFIINLANAYKQGVHMNASLLNLATKVIR